MLFEHSVPSLHVTTELFQKHHTLMWAGKYTFTRECWILLQYALRLDNSFLFLAYSDEHSVFRLAHIECDVLQLLAAERFHSTHYLDQYFEVDCDQLDSPQYVCQSDPEKGPILAPNSADVGQGNIGNFYLHRHCNHRGKGSLLQSIEI